MKRTQFAAILLPLAALCTHVPASVYAQPLPPHAQPQPRPLHDKLLRAIYQELIEINTTDSVGSCTVAAKAMAAQLKAGGYIASKRKGPGSIYVLAWEGILKMNESLAPFTQASA